MIAQGNKDKDVDFQVGSKEEEAAALLMQAAIRAVPPHLFNKDGHAACGAHCPAKQVNTSIYDPDHRPHKLGKYLDPGHGDVLYDAVMAVFSQYSTLEYCKRLIYPGSTNLCEGVNSLMWLVHLPKARLRPTGAIGHMNMAQLHKDKGQGAATLEVLGHARHKPPSPQVAEQIKKRDHKRKRFGSQKKNPFRTLSCAPCVSIFRVAEAAKTTAGKKARHYKKACRKTRSAEDDEGHGGDNHLDVEVRLTNRYFLT